MNNLLSSHFLSQDFSRNNTQLSSCSLFLDLENANTDTLQLSGSSSATRRMDQNLDLKVCFVAFLSVSILNITVTGIYLCIVCIQKKYQFRTL
jgi:hypothetical protein